MKTVGIVRALPILAALTATLAATAQSTPTAHARDRHPPRGHVFKPRKFDILLTNDDGYQTPSIRALRSALIAAGHHVVLVAPDSNKSGSGASLTLAAVPVQQVEPDVYAVSGSPATTVLLGAKAFFAPGELDLVISGPNEGANIGPAAPISGTVGAAIVAISPIGPKVPAIAISTDLLATAPSDPLNLEHNEDVSDFVVRLITQLDKTSRGKALLPQGIALNVNYPALSAEEVQGVKLSVQGQASSFSLGYSEVAPGVYAPAAGAAEASEDVEGSDVTAFQAGYVSVVPIDGDYTAGWTAFGPLDTRLRGLAP